MVLKYMLTVALLLNFTQASPVNLVTNRSSNHSIYYEIGAPKQIATAAHDLQQYIKEISGAQLKIVHQPTGSMIYLGENSASRAAGIDLTKLPLEGFHILTRGDDVFILGHDTTKDQQTPNGGTSHGTANGVYAFIEHFLGVRWLMPGAQGDYVPHAADITIPTIDWTAAPAFQNRRLPYIQKSHDDTKVWIARQRLGTSLYLSHGHNWRRTIPPSHFAAHPDWFAMRNGVRVPPTGRYKLCTTNPEMIREFANTAIRYFDKRPEASCYSLSPSDGAGWCECAHCRALYETDPNGKLSVTPAVLTFYNAVAKLVAETYPNKSLAGYVYADYVFPPQEPIKLEPNVFLVWAPNFDYGFRLYQPKMRQQWETLVAQWTQVTENIAYYDLPNCVHNKIGAPNPPGIKILQFLYPRIKAAKMKGVYIYGNQAWGHSGLMNYLLAKLAWNPEADVNTLFDDYCEKAYAEGAEEMKAFYRLLDNETERYFIEHTDENYALSTERLSNLYAANFPELERLYRSAEAKITDPDALARLQMMGDNLTLLHWTLRQFHILKDETSSFFQKDTDLFALLNEKHASLAISPVVPSGKPTFLEGKLTTEAVESIPNSDPLTKFRLRGDQHIVLKPSGNEAIQLQISSRINHGKLITYSVYNTEGKQLNTGIVSTEVPITLKPDDSKFYHLAIHAESASYQVAVTGANWALDGRVSDKGLWLQGSTSPLYFELKEGIKAFNLELQAAPPGETASATLHSPLGRQAANFDCTRLSVDRQLITVEPGESGIWKLIIKEAPTGALDDVYIIQGKQLSGYFSIAPKQALRVASNNSNNKDRLP
jgi:hypothetical protein